ncbi:class I SAM-dependent methyltransferase [Nocardia sp. CA-120079]|uniref:class I SAM-dependent methyltransferase n=1 Tax=Nocardia sp. CA-120079 TaxID=3239974 RepID=UPI003D985F68
MHGQPSRTAMFAARVRADHQEDAPRIFTDPLAPRIVGESVASTEFDQGQAEDLVRERRLWIAARSRFADDAVAAAITAGTDQVVILGAGLDTTAYRQSSTHVRFFEVDHPATQEWKRRRLAHAGITIPATLTFAPVDFEQPTLAVTLAQAGLDRTRRTLFIWLGVAVYLTRRSVRATLSDIASGHAELVCDYFYPLDSDRGDPTAIQLQNRAKLVARAGEPWRSFFTADEFRTMLQSCGFQQIEDQSITALLATYGVRISRSPDSGPHLIHACTV